MDHPPDPEPRITALEDRVERIEGQTAVARHDAAAARLLAAAADHDNADLKIKVDATRRVLNAHAEQTRAQLDRLDTQMRTGFAGMRTEMQTGFAEVRAEMRTGFAAAAAGQQRIVDLLTREDRG